MSLTPYRFSSEDLPRPEGAPPECPAKEPYVADEALVEAVNLAIHLRRPLLLEGEAGSGKTRLARAVACQLGLPYYLWPVRSTSKVIEGLYTYDALLRLHDVQVQKTSPSAVPALRDPADPKGYRTFGALGHAFLRRDVPAVVLIDEIDKADLDFPNDLLTILDKPLRFDVAETGEDVKAHDDCLPIVFITSNKEKGNLPAPFLRRCLYYYVEFPENTDRLKTIVEAHFPHLKSASGGKLLGAALERFSEVRRRVDLYKKPGTSELLDWVSVLSNFKAKPFSATKLADPSTLLPYPEVLFKVKTDWQRYRAAAP